MKSGSIFPDNYLVMPKLLSHPALLHYPRINFKARANRPADLNSVRRTLGGKFPFLNLAGLAKVPGLAVGIGSAAFRSKILHTFDIHHREFPVGGQPRVVIEQPIKKKETHLTYFFPDLPVGKRLGITMLFLLLTRGNSFAGQKVIVDTASPEMEEAAQRMKGFQVKFSEDKDLTIHVPKLTPDELAATEWYWVNVLKCPLL